MPASAWIGSTRNATVFGPIAARSCSTSPKSMSLKPAEYGPNDEGVARAEAPRIRRDVRAEEEEADAGRRAAAGRAEDGQGLRRGEAPPAAGRQDGRPPRQQGRGLEDRAGRGHAVHGRWHAGRHRAESARRAVADERRPDPGDPPRVGRQGPGHNDRRHAARRRRRSPTSASSSSRSTTRRKAGET